MDHSACGTDDTDLFFAHTSDTDAQRAAVSICMNECPVRAQCLAYAIATNTAEGIWGGLTENDRAILHATHDNDIADQRARHAQRLKQAGRSTPEIAKQLGVCNRTIQRALQTA